MPRTGLLVRALPVALLLPILAVLGDTPARPDANPARPAAAGPEPPYDAADQYAKQTLEGWTVLVSNRLHDDEHRALCERTLRLLDDHLFRVGRVVPPPALEKLRAMPIWVERAHPRHPCMCYHVSADWLREHAMNPEKAGAVEIANAENFLRWTAEQPWMVLHELAHGYHHRVLGYDHAELHACYERAVASGSYASVLHWDHRRVRAYALTNDREYFAESTEAYFGTNDFYPFVRAELREHDPDMHALLEKLWGVQPPAGTTIRP